MKKFSICLLTTIFAFVLTTAHAEGPPNLFFDFNGDATADTELQVETGKSVSVDIYINDWQEAFPDELLFGVTMFLYYDETLLQVNKKYSFANDTDHEGPFDPSFNIYHNHGSGVIQLDVANFNCVSIADKLLLFTLELQGIEEANSEINITVNFNETALNGSVVPAGEDCTPHFKDCGDGNAHVVIAPAGGNDNNSCPAAYLLEDNSLQLNIIREFRDKVLAKNSTGEKIINLYYRNSETIIALLDKNSAVKKAAKKVLESLLPGLKILINSRS